MAGFGTSEAAAAAALLAAVLIVLGLVAGRAGLLAVVPGTVRPPLPTWSGLYLAVVGVVLAVALNTAVPALVLPGARQTLEQYGYAPDVIRLELRLLHLLTVLFPLTLVPIGLIIRFWAVLTRWGAERIQLWGLTPASSVGAVAGVGPVAAAAPAGMAPGPGRRAHLAAA